MLREWLTELLRLALPYPLVQVKGHPGVSCVATERKPELILHLINRTSADSIEARLWFVDQPGETGDIEMELRTDRDPISVTMLLSGKQLDWQRDSESIGFTVPGVYIHEAISHSVPRCWVRRQYIYERLFR